MTGAARDRPTVPEDRIAAYVERGLELIEAGRPIDLDELCADAPDLVQPVARALGLAGTLRDLHERAQGTDGWLGVELAGRYRLDVLLGGGAMGRVYRARDVELGREVAVKLLRTDLFDGLRAAERFLRESEMLAEIAHPRVVRVFDRGRADDGTLFLVMELLSGATLSAALAWACERMPDGPSADYASTDWLAERLPAARLESSFLRQTVKWCAEVASGLAAAHQLGICHRDVKPSNVLIQDDGGAVIVDFGIAGRVGAGGLTASGASIGTPWYMPPEVASGARAPDPRGDVYGLAATLYHLVTLAPPFEDDGPRVLVRVQLEEPVSASRRHPGLPRDLQAILDRGLAKDPRHRYPAIDALGSDLRAFLDHRPVSVRPLGPVRRAWRASRRRPARALAVAGFAGAVAIGAVALPLWQFRADAAATAEHARLVATVPALLTLEGSPRERLLIGEGERREVRGLLDRILALRPDDAQTRLLRAALAIDTGRHDAAAADMAELSDQYPGDAYLAAVAERFAGADRSAAGIGALDLDGLPAPESAAARFVAGFHALRARTAAAYREALEQLTAAGDQVQARDLRLIALLAVGEFQEAHDAALELQGVYGRKTARTQHVIGASLVAMRRYAEAIEPLGEAITLRPGRHGPLHNLGLARLRLGDVDGAVECLERAHEIRPWLSNTLEILSQAYSARGEFGRAYEIAERIPSEGAMGQPWRRQYALAMVRFREALAAERKRDVESAAEASRASAAHFRESERLGAPARNLRSIRASVALMDAVASRDRPALFDQFAARLANDPLNAAHVQNLAALLPEVELEPSQVQSLRLFLLELASALEPQNPEPRAAADAARAEKR